jgi:peptide deformylase
MQVEIDYRKPLEILKYPHPILTMKCVPIEEFNEDLKYFCTQMFLFMRTKLKWGKPVGLAAPQVGLPIRVFIAEEVLYINPEITWETRGPKNLCHEGCYSLEDERYDYPVWRTPSIRLKWQDHTGAWQEKRFNGYHAQVIQHELDHLG